MKKFLIFIDESWDPNLFKIDPQFPVFWVWAIIIEEEYYYSTLLPYLKNMKLKNWFEADNILHSSDIRKHRKSFESLTNDKIRNNFYNDLNNLFIDIDYTIISSIIRKHNLKEKYSSPWCPYDISFKFILERLEHFLKNNNAVWEIYIEKRWWEEKRLISIFENIKKYWNGYVSSKAFSKVFIQDELYFVWKESDWCQLADLICYPITVEVLKKHKNNLAFETVKKKFYWWNTNSISKYGYKIFP